MYVEINTPMKLSEEDEEKMSEEDKKKFADKEKERSDSAYDKSVALSEELIVLNKLRYEMADIMEGKYEDNATYTILKKEICTFFQK